MSMSIADQIDKLFIFSSKKCYLLLQYHIGNTILLFKEKYVCYLTRFSFFGGGGILMEKINYTLYEKR